jgi:hypothetical protein
LLDGVGAGFLFLLFGLGLLFLIAAILIEAWVMQKMKYQASYRTALIQSLTVNLVSLAAGFVLSGISTDLFAVDNFLGFAILFGATVLLEFAVLYLLNRNKPLQPTFMASLVMNLVTYCIAFLLILAVYGT